VHIAVFILLLLPAGGVCAQPALTGADSARAALLTRANDSARTAALLERALNGDTGSWSPLDPLLPNGVVAGYRARVWVRDSLPPESDSVADLDRVDMIYLRALREAGGDIESALLASLIATFEHRTIPFTFGFDLPLTFEPRDLFDRRVARLPGHLFLDHPNGGDRDKLQHFFASAWLAHTLDNGLLADIIGQGVEQGESSFIVGGADDPRDIRANRLGQLFVELLATHPRALPSSMFRAWNRRYVEGRR
jgi:hypothetical protein